MSARTFEPISIIVSPFVLIEQENVDTDQILPGKFLTTIDRKGLGEKAFYHWRFDESGGMKSDSLFNSPQSRVSKILVAASNFGCGSSREHAAWALYDYGFRVILSPQLGDIFRSNCLMNGILAAEIDREMFQSLRRAGGAQLCVDLRRCEIVLDDKARSSFDIDPLARLCLLDGLDPLGFLLSNDGAIRRFELQRISRRRDPAAAT